MSTQFVPALISSFPWLTEEEAASVAERITTEVGDTSSASTQLAAIAHVLDAAGLPPTSTLLLSLAGRGSKATAVAIARSTARARFEKARQSAGHQAGTKPAGQGDAARLDVDQLRDLVHATVESVLAATPGMFGASTGEARILNLLERMSGEVTWLKSTIDTERQLRRYREAHGPLPEHQAPQGPATAAGRRGLVHQLADSLEQERFKGQGDLQVDSADGRGE